MYPPEYPLALHIKQNIRRVVARVDYFTMKLDAGQRFHFRIIKMQPLRLIQSQLWLRASSSSLTHTNRRVFNKTRAHLFILARLRPRIKPIQLINALAHYFIVNKRRIVPAIQRDPAMHHHSE